MGVEAYRGATQINIVEPMNGHPDPLLPQSSSPKHLTQNDQPINTTISMEKQQDLPTRNSKTVNKILPVRSNDEKQRIRESQVLGQKKILERNQDASSAMYSYAFKPISSISESPILNLSTEKQSDICYSFSQNEYKHSENGNDAAVTSNDSWSCKGSKCDKEKAEQSAAHQSCDACHKQVLSNHQQRNHSVDLNSEKNLNIPAVNKQYPHEAKYLVDHVVYLPVNKLVPFHVLNIMLARIHSAVGLVKNGHSNVKVQIPSKL